MSYTRAMGSSGACCSGCAAGASKCSGGLGDTGPVDYTVHPGESWVDYIARIAREQNTTIKDAEYLVTHQPTQHPAVQPAVTAPGLPGQPASTTTKLLLVGGAALALYMLTRKKRR